MKFPESQLLCGICRETNRLRFFLRKVVLFYLNEKEMSERYLEKQTYPFYWLDETVEMALNPDKTNLKNIGAADLKVIRDRIPVEIAAITTCLKKQAFCLYCTDHIKVVAGHYDQAVRLLEKQAVFNLSKYPKTGALHETGQLIVDELAALASCLYNRYPAYLPPPESDHPILPPGLLTKVLCALSADQLGILLRAATDVGILVGRSFRKVCAAFAPFLSTPWKKDIKHDTMRSHATRPESRDKDVAIAFLEKMIEKIKGYR